MDKTTKFILGLIAVALIGINIQMWNGKTGLIKPAYAVSNCGGDPASEYACRVRVINWP